VENSAAVPILEPLPGTTVDDQRSGTTGPPRQAPLFDDRPKIIPFESISRAKNRPRRQPVDRRAPRPNRQPPAVRPNAQAPLDLRSPAALERKAVSYDAPVAGPRIRLRAALLDALLLLAGIGAAGVAFHLMGGRFQWAGRAALPYACAGLALVLFYHLFWSVLGAESAGMRCLGLRVLTFDGHRPGWLRLTFRFGLLCLGTLAVGLGLLWALVDEEGLTMHDHISKTFPTDDDPNPSTLRRR
jgi:uncharacterized RDD family membrane protein YckC